MPPVNFRFLNCKHWGSGIDKALQPYLEKEELNGVQDKITSSHPSYEKVCKKFIEKNFPNRFSSYREYHAADMFRRRMCEHHLWDKFISWANNHCDFQQASQLEAGSIYRTCSLVARKLLVYANPADRDEDRFTWAHITLSTLKCCLPTASMTIPGSTVPWSQPYLFQKATDCEKVDLLLAPMQDSRASKAPERKEPEVPIW